MEKDLSLIQMTDYISCQDPREKKKKKYNAEK